MEFEYVEGPRVLPDGTNMDADVIASHPKVKHRRITDPVNDGSLGHPTYVEGSKNRDGSDLQLGSII